MKLNFTRFIIIASLFITVGVQAQQDPQFTQFMFNNLVINPAVAGSKESISAFVLSRSQWVGLDGNPETQTLSVHKPFEAISSGAGIHIINEKIGFSSNLSFMGDYAYKYELANGVLSGGVSLGFVQNTLDGTKLRSVDGTDPRIPKGKENSITLDAGLGIYYTTENYYAGISTTHINQGKIRYATETSETNSKLSRHVYLTGGYSYPLSANIDIKPSVLVKFQNNAQFELNTNVFYRQKYWAGVSYRSSDAINALIGLNITESLKFCYSYDVNVSKLSAYNQGSHEFSLGYDLFVLPRVKSDIIIRTPRFL